MHNTDQTTRFETLFPSNKHTSLSDVYCKYFSRLIEYENLSQNTVGNQLLLLLLRLLLLHRLLLLLGATLLDKGACIEEPVLVLTLGVGVQGPYLGRVVLLGGHIQLHCVAVLGEEKVGVCSKNSNHKSFTLLPPR